jgi:hypothetical protein
MADKTGPKADGITPANDNNGAADDARHQKIDRAVLTIACIIGRRIAREQFETRHAANDNGSGAAGSAEDRVDED